MHTNITNKEIREVVGTSKSGAKRLTISPSLNEHLKPFSAQANAIKA